MVAFPLTMLRALSLSAVTLLLLACSDEEPSQTTLPQFGTQPQFGTEAPGATPAPGSGPAETPGGAEQPAAPSDAPAPANDEGTPAVGGLTPAEPSADSSGETAAAAPSGMDPAAMDPALVDPAAVDPAAVDPAAVDPAAMDPAAMAPTAPTQPTASSFPPSAGCGTANPPRGAGSLTIRGAQADYLVTLPANYNPNTPTPLIFGFHGRGRTHLEFQTVDASQIQTELGTRAVMVYMKSQGGNGWNNPAEVAPSVEFFEALYPQVLGNYCVDTAQIFVIGHSSGAMFSQILACRFGERFRGVAAIAGRQQETNCASGRVPALLIHGTTDTVVPFADGLSAREFYLARNGCDAGSAPAAVSPCVSHQGCDAGLPVQWCQHTEPTYTDAATGRTTNHGWPSFASRAINNFFFSLPPRGD